jgi:DNA primase
MLSNFVVMTWSGGAAAVHKADWRALKGRDVTLWPDNDDAGHEAMVQAAVGLKAAGARRIAIAPAPKEALPAK